MTNAIEQAAAAERRTDAIGVFGATSDLVGKKILPHRPSSPPAEITRCR
jgi:hypothetical protein